MSTKLHLYKSVEISAAIYAADTCKRRKKFTYDGRFPPKMLAHHTGHFMASSRYQYRVDEEGWDAGPIEYCQSEKTDNGMTYTTATTR